MKHLFILLFGILFFPNGICLAQSSDMLFLHGNYTDPEWEQLEFVQEAGGTSVYYLYAQAKSGKLKLIVKEELQIAGRSILKVEFPKIAKLYFITLEEDMKTLKMNDEQGNYEKIFRFYPKTEKTTISNPTDKTNIQISFQWFLKISPDYCSDEDCDKAAAKWRKSGGDMECNLGVAKEKANYIYGDINQDGKTDAIVSFDITQCDGGNALCGRGDQVLIISTMSSDYKVIVPIFNDHNTGAWHNMTNINPDGSILSYNYLWAKNDQRCQPSIEKKVTYRLKNGELVGKL